MTLGNIVKQVANVANVYVRTENPPFDPLDVLTIRSLRERYQTPVTLPGLDLLLCDPGLDPILDPALLTSREELELLVRHVANKSIDLISFL